MRQTESMIRCLILPCVRFVGLSEEQIRNNTLKPTQGFVRVVEVLVQVGYDLDIGNGVSHVKTKQELLELEKYEKEKIRYGWASKPQIRTWDYIFNGNLKICIFDGKYFQDTNSSLIETQLGNILIDLYEKSEIVRIEREAREEEQRIKEEKRRQEELFRQRRNQEIDRTISLVNEAEDFAIACKIRAYVSAVASKPNLSDKEKIWIEWASKKADWYDPSIALEDELLGTREHPKNNEAKALKKSGYWW